MIVNLNPRIALMLLEKSMEESYTCERIAPGNGFLIRTETTIAILSIVDDECYFYYYNMYIQSIVPHVQLEEGAELGLFNGLFSRVSQNI